jgi:membrane protein implicated in regulation of membrane protease activity
MNAALPAGGFALAAADLVLLVACWKRRSVLAGVLAAPSLPLAAFAFAAGPDHPPGEYWLLIATVALVLGAALYAIDQLLERLLDQEPRNVIQASSRGVGDHPPPQG